MTYTQAKMIIWNPECYPVEKKKQAVAFILGSITTLPSDLNQAFLIAEELQP